MINIKRHPTKQDAASSLANELASIIKNNKGEKYNIAISGGSTPFIMFEALIKNKGEKLNWENVHFYWVDERCVEPTSKESNFGNTKKTLFDKINIPSNNIHRVLGENDAIQEAVRYSSEIKNSVAYSNDIPQFDLILLGMGDDGHTASIFPPQIEFIDSKEIAVVAKNPYSGQTRISLTGTVINNAKRIIFLVTGRDKSAVLKEIYYKRPGYLKFPAAQISTAANKTTWYLDAEAAPFL